MTRVVAIVSAEADRQLRAASRGTLTAIVLGGYLGGVLAAAGGLVLVGVRIGRKTA